MRTYSLPSTLLSLHEDGAFAEIRCDGMRPFGRVEVWLNEVGLERHANLIDAHRCDGLALAYDGRAEKGKYGRFSPDLSRVRHPENITALHIGSAGRFARDFDFNAFERFGNVRSLSVDGVPVIDEVVRHFPELETLRIFDWAKNKIRRRDGVWPRLRHLHIAGFRGDLSIFAGWNIECLFLHHGRLAPFASLRAFPDLETFAAERLAADIDLALLSDLPRLKHLSLSMLRRPARTAGFTSRTLKMMVLHRADPADLDGFDLARDFPALEFYGIDFGRKREFMRWDGFRGYGDPFRAVDHVRPLPPG